MEYEKILRSGQLIVARTDTIYGILALANDHRAVKAVYELKGRDYTKPCIILVGDSNEIPTLTPEQKRIYLLANAERPTSVIVSATIEPEWITRGTATVAYRLCTQEELRTLLQESGPVIAPSANPQGLPPARTAKEAKDYFADRVAAYIDGGEVPSSTPPSRIMQFIGKQLVHVAR